MDSATLLWAAALVAGFLVTVFLLRRGLRQADPTGRIDFDRHKSREQSVRGLAGRP